MVEFFFRPEFLLRLGKAAKKLHASKRAESKHQWSIARMVNDEWCWIEQEFGKGEINKLYFYAATSERINAALPFPICAASGETLRRWCEVAASYANMDVSMLETALSFEHFRVARSLAKLPKNERAGNTPYAILLRAAQEPWTVDEMETHFGDGFDQPNDYERAVGWLDSLQASKFDWIRVKADREEIKMHLSRVREIVSFYELPVVAG